MLGHQIKVYTDHENLTYKQFNTNRVMRWRLLLEEFGPELIYIKGTKNIVADALSRLERNEDDTKDLQTFEEVALYNAEAVAPPKIELYPLRFKTIMKHQKEDKELLQAAEANVTNNYHFKIFRGGGKKYPLLCHSGKIVIPKTLQKRIVEWYHTTLLHPGETRTELTLRQHFTWKGLRNTVQEVCKNCPTCQRTKRSHKKYGIIPPKEAEANPWEKLCVDMIGPYTIKQGKGKEAKIITINCVTMIDPATGWFEMVSTPQKDAGTVANIVETTWFTRYPLPEELVYDRGSEFLGEFARMIEEDYGIKKRPTTTRNPRANSILERAHQTLGNMLRTFEIHSDKEVTEENVNGILSAIMFAMRATVHTTNQATPMQLVFGRDALMNIKFKADWNYIRQRKQEIINKNNRRENKQRIPHTYKVGDKVMLNISETSLSKYGINPFSGPFTVRHVNDNGTVVLQMGSVLDTWNIRNIKPYNEN